MDAHQLFERMKERTAEERARDPNTLYCGPPWEYAVSASSETWDLAEAWHTAWLRTWGRVQ